MTIQLKPEAEAFIEIKVQSGAFSNPDEVIERALEFLSVEEDWLSENRDEIAKMVDEGWDEAQRDVLSDGEQVRVELEQFKAKWIKQHHQA